MEFQSSFQTKRRFMFFALAWLCVWTNFPAWATPVNLTVSPTTISNTYTGPITLTITGLTNGEQVAVHDYLDANANGVIDAGDAAVFAFKVTDGQSYPTFDGVPDTNVPGDIDGLTNGAITTTLSFNKASELMRLSGHYLFVVVSTTGRFSPVTSPLVVTQAVYSQRIYGQIQSGGSGVPYAGVALLTQSGTDFTFVTGTVADSAGNYSLTNAPGTYVVLPVKSNYVANMSNPVQVVLGSGQSVSTNVNLTAATTSISLTASNSSNGSTVGGLQFFAQSTAGWVTLACTSTNGNLTIPVTADTWKLDYSDACMALKGFVRPQNKISVNTTGGAVTGLGVSLTKENALIYGNLKNSSNVPLTNVGINCNDSAQIYSVNPVTDANGNYLAGVVGAPGPGGTQWFIGPNPSDPGLAGYIAPSGTNITIISGQAAQLNFVAGQATAQLQGHVTSNGVAVAGITILAISQNSSVTAQTVTANDGSFSLGVSGGQWNLQLEQNSAAAFNLLGPSLTFAVTDGVNITNIGFYVVAPTASITGYLHNQSFAGLSGIGIFASATINGTNYNQNTQTDSNGNYSLGVINGNWQVSADSFGLAALGYGQPQSHYVTINNSGGTANFTVSLVQDVLLYLVEKGRWYWQNNAATVVQATNSPTIFGQTVTGPYCFFTEAVLSDPGDMNGATVTLPNNVTVVPLANQLGSSPPTFAYAACFSSQSAQDAAYPSGNYEMVLHTVHNGTKTIAMNLSGDTFLSSPPQFSNYSAAQSIDPAVGFLLTWNAFSGGTVNDVVLVRVYNNSGQIIYSTPTLTNGLNGTETSTTIPANTMGFGQNYQIQLGFLHTATYDPTDYSGATGVTDYGNFTTMNVATAPLANPGLGQSQFITGGPNSGQFSFHLSGQDGVNYRLDATTDFTNWVTLGTNQTSGGFYIFNDPASSGLPHRFYRAVVLP